MENEITECPNQLRKAIWETVRLYAETQPDLPKNEIDRRISDIVGLAPSTVQEYRLAMSKTLNSGNVVNFTTSGAGKDNRLAKLSSEKQDAVKVEVKKMIEQKKKDGKPGHATTKDLELAIEKITGKEMKIGGLDVAISKELRNAETSGKLTPTEIKDIIPVLKDSKPERREAILQKIIKDNEEAEDFKKEALKESAALGNGTVTKMQIVKDPDIKRLERFKEINDKIQWWGVETVELIKSEKMRKKACEYIKNISNKCDDLYLRLQKKGLV